MDQKYSSAFYAGRLCNKFARSGGPGRFTMPFEDFPAETRAELLRQIQVEDDECPALACFWSHRAWVVLTTKRLLWLRGGVVSKVDWSELENVSPPPLDQLHREKLDIKTENMTLVVTLRDQRMIEIEIEPGGPFFGFLNALQMCAVWGNRT